MKRKSGYLPGLAVAICGHALPKLMARTGLTYEFTAFLVTCLPGPVDSATQNCGKRL